MARPSSRHGPDTDSKGYLDEEIVKNTYPSIYRCQVDKMSNSTRSVKVAWPRANNATLHVRHELLLVYLGTSLHLPASQS